MCSAVQGPAAAASKEAMLLSLCSKAFAGGRTIVFLRTKAQALSMLLRSTAPVPDRRILREVHFSLVSLDWLVRLLGSRDQQLESDVDERSKTGHLRRHVVGSAAR